MMLFLPERFIPDEFYTTFDITADFEREDFLRFRVEMDRDMRWVERVESIINDHPVPRLERGRPDRPAATPSLGAIARQTVGEASSLSKSRAAVKHSRLATRGREEYLRAMSNGHRRFFYATLEQCAIRYVGLVFTCPQPLIFRLPGVRVYCWSRRITTPTATLAIATTSGPQKR